MSKPDRRLLLLVRHGNYNRDETENGRLTPLGREQALRVGRYLAEVPIHSFFCSTMPRAQETATIVGRELGQKPRATNLLREGFPTRLRGYDTTGFEEDVVRFGKAFDRFFAVPGRRSTDLLVCHGNIIRYFVCRVLGLAKGKWIRLGTNHASITRVVIKSTGEMGIASFNDTAHLPRKLVT